MWLLLTKTENTMAQRNNISNVKGRNVSRIIDEEQNEEKERKERIILINVCNMGGRRGGRERKKEKESRNMTS
jgi:hypothetical protein